MDSFLDWAGVSLAGGQVTYRDEDATDAPVAAVGDDVSPAVIRALGDYLLATDPGGREAVLAESTVEERVALAETLSPRSLGRVYSALRSAGDSDVDAALLRRAARRASHRRATDAAVAALGRSAHTAAWAVAVGAMDEAAERYLLDGGDVSAVFRGQWQYKPGPVIRLVAARRALTGAEQEAVVASGYVWSLNPATADPDRVAAAAGTSVPVFLLSARWLAKHYPQQAAHMFVTQLAVLCDTVPEIGPNEWVLLASVAAGVSPDVLAAAGAAMAAQAGSIAAQLTPRGRALFDTALWTPTRSHRGRARWRDHAAQAVEVFDAPLTVLAAFDGAVPPGALDWAVDVWLHTNSLASAQALLAAVRTNPNLPGLLLAAGEWWSPGSDVTALVDGLDAALAVTGGPAAALPAYWLGTHPAVPLNRLLPACTDAVLLWAVASAQVGVDDWLAGTVDGATPTPQLAAAAAALAPVAADGVVTVLNRRPERRSALMAATPLSLLQPAHRSTLTDDAARFVRGWLAERLGDDAQAWQALSRQVGASEGADVRLEVAVAQARQR